MILALVGAMAIQAGTNLINDYYDFRSGADSEQSLGPSMVIQRGLLSADQVWRGGIAAFTIGALIGLVLVYLCGWPILAIGIPSVAAGYFYTASPVSLAYVALGELTVFIFMGPAIVIGSYFVMAMHFSPSAFGHRYRLDSWSREFARQQYSRHRERHSPWKANARDDPGTCGANYELIALDVAAYATTIVAIVLHALPWIALAVFITIPRALDQVRIMTRETDPKKSTLVSFDRFSSTWNSGWLMIAAFLIAAFAGW